MYKQIKTEKNKKNESKTKRNENKKTKTKIDRQMLENHIFFKECIQYTGCIAQLLRTCLCWYQSLGKNINPTVNVLVTWERKNSAKNIAPGLHSGK